MFSNDPLVNILDRLVSFPTIDGEEQAMSNCFNYVSTYLKKRGMHNASYVINGHRSMVSTTKPTKSPKILLQAHLDVVPGHDDQFALRKKEEKLAGRGVIDMKFAAASFMYLVDNLKINLQKYDFGIMLTSDEEIGGENGVKALLDKGYGSEVCILPDGGNNWHLASSAKGAWFVRITARGDMAHGSRPWEGKSATEKLINSLVDIRKHFDNKNKESNTLTISTLLGGSAMNQVADSAEATLDIRFIDKKNFNQIEKMLFQVAKKHEVSTQTIDIADAYRANTSHPLVKSFINIANEKLDKPIKSTTDYGSSDARFFASHGIPCVLTRPTGNGAHTDHEWISLNDLHAFHSIIVDYIKKESYTSSN